MQNQPTPPPSAPQAPVITYEPETNVFTLAPPLTARDIRAIRERREELSDQLTSASGRRSRLVEQLNETTNETARQGLEERIALLDKRMLQLETDIAATGQQLTSAPAGLLAATEATSTFMPGLGSGQVTAVSIVFTVAVLGPIALGLARMMFKRSSRPVLPAAFTETAQRLERLEQSIDTIAIEIERVSEGQRFVTKLLSEGQHAPAIGAGKRPEAISAGNQ
jgi:archaellum component FlaC